MHGPYDEYKGKIVNDNETFEVNNMHLKIWMEEHLPGYKFRLQHVHKLVGSIFKLNSQYTILRRTKITVDVDKAREFNNNTRVNVYVYKFPFKEFTQEEVKIKDASLYDIDFSDF